MKAKILKAKNRLLELGYLDNEYLEKYLEILEANLETKKVKRSTQAHHAIPVTDYWVSDKPYKRCEALKLARVDNSNFEVNLLYKDHLAAHAYLTLCTNLDKAQQKYEAQEELRKRNSEIGLKTAIEKGVHTDSPNYKFKKSKKQKVDPRSQLKYFYSDDEIEDILDL